MTQYLKQAPMYSPEVSEAAKTTVSEMLSRIEREGIDAVRAYSRKLDDWDPESFVVPPSDIQAASEQLDDELREHIEFAQEQVRDFAHAQHNSLLDIEVEARPGVTLGHRHIPVTSVGSYVPGGRYPMLASAFMTVIVPKVAGVERVVAVAPPREGRGVHPAMLHAMATSGADQILCLGGVQALAALAFGIEEIPGVDMIVGAGNAYVAEAKRQLFGKVGIDLLAGPTEILVIADEQADPELVAADLLGQAEHGPTSPAILIATSQGVAQQSLTCLERLLKAGRPLRWPAKHGAIMDRSRSSKATRRR